jgi:hypothetical protein
MGCAHYVYLVPAQSLDATQGTNAGTANLAISDNDLAKTSSAHFGLVGFLFPVSVRWGKAVPEYLSNCTRRVFSDVTVNGQGKYDAVFEVKITEADVSALTGKATVTLLIDGKWTDGRSLVHGEYSGSGTGHFPLYQDTVYQWKQVETTTHQALTNACNTFINDVRLRLAR